ncbi:hypothetical protein FB566_3255 [Stackebrandtia endophytica]|uniref:Uncharacterized protein n=1 Tax=Stackebrandtia endophytica TaxID=1496996 RepID=A0A543AYP8_9ACTN|nr:hypothetical protein [Stackebrandtia endophytica]TQL77693.1 hypothetical protein FB566_3255 [Stackebrandtia endophytica]
MYDDNAWPQAAGIDAFIEERRRPQRVTVACVALLVAGGASLLSGILYGVFGIAASDGMALVVGLLVGAAIAGWCAVLAKVGWVGRRWAANPARYTGLGLFLLLAVFAALDAPRVMTELGELLGGIYVIPLGAGALSGAVAFVGLLGTSVSEYFDPPVQPSPFANQPQSMMGNDADWGPPRQAPYSPSGQPGYPPGQGYPPPPQR